MTDPNVYTPIISKVPALFIIVWYDSHDKEWVHNHPTTYKSYIEATQVKNKLEEQWKVIPHKVLRCTEVLGV